MLGEFSRKKELNGSLDLSGGKSVLLVVSDELAGFQSDSFVEIHDEGVHNVHGLLADTSFRVNLSKNSVDVDAEGFLSSSLWGLLVTGGLWGLFLLFLGGSFSCDGFLWWHL